jgi:hypothetical protein
MTLVDVDLEIEKSEGAAELEPIAATAKSATKSSDHVSTLAAADLPSIHTDPFASREGKTLTWKNINMTLVSNLSSWQFNQHFILTYRISIIFTIYIRISTQGGER